MRTTRYHKNIWWSTKIEGFKKEVIVFGAYSESKRREIHNQLHLMKLVDLCIKNLELGESISTSKKLEPGHLKLVQQSDEFCVQRISGAKKLFKTHLSGRKKTSHFNSLIHQPFSKVYCK